MKKSKRFAVFFLKISRLIILLKMIQEGFSPDESDGNLDNDLKQIPPYRPSKNVTIDATRAAQLIME